MKRRRWRWLRPLLVLLPLYALIVTFGGCADRFLLHPSRHAIDAGGAQRRTVELHGRQIEIWTARSPAIERGAGGERGDEGGEGAGEGNGGDGGSREPAGFVLEYCGNATRAEQIAQFLATRRWKDYPVEVWVMNYPGFGGSDGRAELQSIAPAALATFDALAQHAGGRPIFLAGNSMGTVPALYVAARRAVAGLILQNPPPLRQLVLGRYGWWNLWLAAGPVSLQIPRELDSLSSAPKVTEPAVFLIAERDTLVPPPYQRQVVDAYRGPKRIIDLPEATHWHPVRGQAEAQLAAEIERLWNDHAEKLKRTD